MQQLSLHRKFYHVKSIDETEYSKKVFDREKKLKNCCQLLAAGCDPTLVFATQSISRAMFYRWRFRYRTYGLIGLENQSTCPNKVRQPLFRQEIEEKVLRIRHKFRVWGKEKIAVVLEREYGIKASPSSVGRILSQLIKRGVVKPAYFYQGIVKIKRSRIFNKHAQRWKYGMKAEKPGDLIQIDHAIVELPMGGYVRHFSAVCPITKIAVEQVYEQATSTHAANFLAYAATQFPFKMASVQVDGGSEFMDVFEAECKKRSIGLYILPPKSPKFNGVVERLHYSAKYEFYCFYDGPTTIESIRLQLLKYIQMYNTYRPHQSLHYKTPWQYFKSLGA